jgi:hypothetical protein
MTKARDISKLLSTANGKIAGANLDVSFENITDTGTEGTKVASGTTGQRGTTAGQLRFNTTTGLAEYYTGTAFKSIDAPPTVSSIDVSEVASDGGGNQTIVITGTGFNSGATVTFVGASGTDFNASTVTVDSDTQITAVAPQSSFLNAQEPYGVKVENTSGLSATLASQINVDASPTWSTASGSLGSVVGGQSLSFSVTATDADGDTIAYSETTSVLSGAGASLNSATGAITGTASDVSANTTNTFTLRATANSKTADRQFSFISTANTIINHSSSNWSQSSPTNLTAETSGRYFTSGSYQWGVAEESNPSGQGSGDNAWLTNPGSSANYWRSLGGLGNAVRTNSMETYFAGNNVTIKNIVIYTYDGTNYNLQSAKLDYWNGSDWIKVAGIGSWSGSSTGWSWVQNGSNNRVNTITYTGSSPQTFKSTNWRFFFGYPGTEEEIVGGDVLHLSGATNLNFSTY